MNENVSCEQYECEISFGGEADLKRRYASCQKNPGHKRFVPLSSFTKEHLPKEYSTDDVFQFIKILADLTTRIVVSHTSEHRPEKWPGRKIFYPFHEVKDSPGCIRTGTGVIDFVWKVFSPVHGKCPCHECLSSGDPCENWWMVRVHTATHVVYDTSEAKSTVLECFFNSEDCGMKVKNIYGLYVSDNPGRLKKDWCVLVCATHDKELALQLMDLNFQKKQICNQRKDSSADKGSVVIISHPHGCPKMISVGYLHSITIPAISNNEMYDPIPFKDETVCCLPKRCGPMKNSLLSSSRSIVRSLHCDIDITSRPGTSNSIQLVPGAEFMIPKGTVYSLPPNPPFARKITSHGTSYSFPAKTRFILSDGREFQLPPETQFFGSSFHDMTGMLSYTAETCPGSSGACVIFLGHLSVRPGSEVQIFTHSCTTSNGLNKSSVGFFTDVNPLTKP